MKTLKVNGTGDIQITGNNFVVIQNDEELEQYLTAILSIRKGEWFTNTTLGLSHENLIGEKFNRELIILDAREALFQESRVESIQRLDVNFDKVTRVVSIDFRVTASGQLIEGVIII